MIKEVDHDYNVLLKIKGAFSNGLTCVGLFVNYAHLKYTYLEISCLK